MSNERCLAKELISVLLRSVLPVCLISNRSDGWLASGGWSSCSGERVSLKAIPGRSIPPLVCSSICFANKGKQAHTVAMRMLPRERRRLLETNAIRLIREPVESRDHYHVYCSHFHSILGNLAYSLALHFKWVRDAMQKLQQFLKKKIPIDPARYWRSTPRLCSRRSVSKGLPLELDVSRRFWIRSDPKATKSSKMNKIFKMNTLLIRLINLF